MFYLNCDKTDLFERLRKAVCVKIEKFSLESFFVLLSRLYVFLRAVRFAEGVEESL